MSDSDVIELFNDLNSRYPMAAAGLIDQLCSKLGCLLQEQSDDHEGIAGLCDTLAQCFRPLDASSPGSSYPWDAANGNFGKWLMRDLPHYRAAVVEITGWNDEQLAQCKSFFIDMVRITRDDWVRAAQQLDADDSG